MAYITDGYQTLISFALAPGILFKEKEVQPPGLDSNGEVDTTTMRNIRWRTKQPKHLITATDVNFKASYDPAVFQTIINDLIGKNNILSVLFPDGSVVEVWGWLDKFVPDTNKEGEFPLADCVFHCSNQDNNNVEQPPIYNAA